MLVSYGDDRCPVPASQGHGLPHGTPADTFLRSMPAPSLGLQLTQLPCLCPLLHMALSTMQSRKSPTLPVYATNTLT